MYLFVSRPSGSSRWEPATTVGEDSSTSGRSHPCGERRTRQLWFDPEMPQLLASAKSNSAKQQPPFSNREKCFVPTLVGSLTYQSQGFWACHPPALMALPVAQKPKKTVSPECVDLEAPIRE